MRHLHANRSGVRARVLFYGALCALGLFLFVVGTDIGGQQELTPASVAIVPIHGEINRAQVILLRRAIEQAKEENAEFLILEIDTFGGRVDSALQITTLIGSSGHHSYNCLCAGNVRRNGSQLVGGGADCVGVRSNIYVSRHLNRCRHASDAGRRWYGCRRR